MTRHTTWALTALLLASVAAAGASAAVPAVPETQGEPQAQGQQGSRPSETMEPPDVSTGQHGTTSGITGSDMGQAEESTSAGQSRGDTLFQTDDAGTGGGPLYETDTPEREPAALPDDPLGAEKAGRVEDGETQASADQSTGEAEESSNESEDETEGDDAQGE